ncbi:MAG: hypothetical protein FWD23_12965, partial [Oscillospiraceae bacterium]|nr:hypothetical protein [Oscillospiraceae bacterium]
MKKHIAFVLILSLLISIVFIPSCGETDEKTPVRDSDGENAVDPVDPEQNEAALKDSLPEDLDFEGAVVNLLIPGGEVNQVTMDEFYAERETGDIINDAVYRRNMAAEERLNVKLNVICGPDLHHWDEMNRMIRNSIASGDNSYQLIAGWSARAPALALDGLFLDMKPLPYLNL